MEDTSFRVASVEIITTLLDAKSKRRDSNAASKKTARGPSAKKQEAEEDFHGIFIGKTIGYTRKGQVYVGQGQQKEYM